MLGVEQGTTRRRNLGLSKRLQILQSSTSHQGRVFVGSRTRDRSKGEPGRVEKDLRSSGYDDLQPDKKKVLAIFNQSRGKTKKSSLLHITSTE
jgi:hypothetical protein